MNDFNYILKKLESFIKKYYIFKILRGTFFVLGLSVMLVLLVSLVEYFNYMDVKLKTFIFYSSISLFVFLFIYYFLFPTLSLFKLRKRLDYRSAAKFVSRFFPDINDKLLNTLELNDLMNNSSNKDLLLASINQRTTELTPFPFTKAINFNFLKNRFLFFGASFFILLFIYVFTPGVVSEGTSRLLDYSQQYEPNAPFSFNLINSDLHCEKAKNFVVKMQVKGEYLPAEVFIEMNGNRFLMDNSKEKGVYSFEFRNVNNSFYFNFFADEFSSKIFEIKVLPTPIFTSFSMDIIPPNYTGIEKSRVLNAGDISVPQGTSIQWNFTTINVDTVFIGYNSDTVSLNSKDNNFSHKKMILKNTDYSVSFANQYFKKDNAVKYKIEVIPDNFPEISMKKIEDSLKVGAYYFVLSIKDDYGFKDLRFICKGDNSRTNVSKPVKINPNLASQNVFYYFNFNDLSLGNSSNFEYYFELRDNDYINGYKSVRTNSLIFTPLSKDTITSISENYESEVNNSINTGKQIANEIRKEISDFKKRELSEKVSDWEKQQFLKNIQKKQKQLNKIIKNSAKKNMKKNMLNNQYYKEQKKILEKQKQLQKLLDEVMDDELRNLLKEIDKLSNKFDDKKFQDIKNKINFSYKDVDKKLDRNLELLKRYQVEENISKLAEDLKELSKKQEELSNNKELSKDKSEYEKQQQEISKQFEQIKENFEKTLDKNKELKSPYKLNEFKEKFNKIQNKLNDIQQNFQKNSNNKNRKSQKKISEEMQQLNEEMQSMMQKMSAMSLDMNMEDLRQIIDNLSVFSFAQEDNYVALQSNYKTSPKFPDILREQKKLENDFSIVKDSVEALSSKMLTMGSLLTKETNKLHYDLANATRLLEKRDGRNTLSIQRQIITSTNTLALYLDELMQQMKNQKNQSSGSDSKDGAIPKKDMLGLKKQQQKLKDELEKMIEQMKKNKGKKKGNGYNTQLVKTLAEQEIFSKMIQEMQEGKSLNPETEQKLKEIRRMSEQNVQDLINENIGNHLLNRNKQIKTRLLEAEKADRKQEEDSKRHSKAGNKDSIVLPPELQIQLEKDVKYKEILHRNNLKFNKYYNDLTKQYFQKVND